MIHTASHFYASGHLETNSGCAHLESFRSNWPYFTRRATNNGLNDFVTLESLKIMDTIWRDLGVLTQSHPAMLNPFPPISERHFNHSTNVTTSVCKVVEAESFSAQESRTSAPKYVLYFIELLIL